MKTSRFSRRTAEIVEALATPRRSTRGRTTIDTSNGTARTEQDSNSSAPSSPAKSPEVPILAATNLTPESISSRKRKRAGIDGSTPRRTVSKVEDSTTIEHSVPAALSPFPRKPRRQPAKPIKQPNTGEVLKAEPPPNWEETYRLTQEMRKERPAAVDTMGCETLSDTTRSPRDQRFQTLIALMLSSQTKDTVTAAAIQRLQAETPGGFCLESLRALPPDKLNTMIEKVGFHNNKTKYIKAAAEICSAQHGGDIPDTIEDLMALPGVGPKMAYLCMSAAWGRHVGIGVDVHVHRITNLWGWHSTKTPEETRAMLERWLPRDKWHEINHLLVGFGQTWCPPVGRTCGECRLAERGLCPSADLKRTPVKAKAKRKKMVVEGEEKVEKVKKEETAEVVGVKMEDANEQGLSGSKLVAKSETLDIEDLGQSSRRRSRRLAS
ncbi:MAG: DNA N-glycosylase and apurinic/apyrimidinic (AP) lyase [Alyxoria varia]|nr:MAG: DNA N-glycosylase and apurinic/apyrimidinic (AP) lyase [Alyxoria varia]